MHNDDGPDSLGNYTTEQAAKILRLNESTINRYRIVYELPVIQVGQKRFMWPIEAINEIHNRLARDVQGSRTQV
ncbi:MAG: hypothetical protein R3268_00025 [Acidiferrobacterales bacterium]|nr:hypothetical protein [Acidiferrobacterales bacterium]